MISTSIDQYNKMVMNGLKEETIYAFLPSDSWKCECQATVLDIKTRLSTLLPKDQETLKKNLGIIRCPRAANKNKYNIYCNKCNEHVADVAADNEHLDDWCDLHYISTSYIDGDGSSKWKGALAINISPIDGKIGIECCCGNDTRDFRANSTLPGKVVKRKMQE